MKETIVIKTKEDRLVIDRSNVDGEICLKSGIITNLSITVLKLPRDKVRRILLQIDKYQIKKIELIIDREYDDFVFDLIDRHLEIEDLSIGHPDRSSSSRLINYLELNENLFNLSIFNLQFRDDYFDRFSNALLKMEKLTCFDFKGYFQKGIFPRFCELMSKLPIDEIEISNHLLNGKQRDLFNYYMVDNPMVVCLKWVDIYHPVPFDLEKILERNFVFRRPFEDFF